MGFSPDGGIVESPNEKQIAVTWKPGIIIVDVGSLKIIKEFKIDDVIASVQWIDNDTILYEATGIMTTTGSTPPKEQHITIKIR